MSAAIGSVRAIFTASAGGLVQATGAAGAALKKLGVDVRGLGSSMAVLQGVSAGGIDKLGPAAEKSEKTLRLLRGRMEGLAKQLQAGTITADEYAASLARINDIAAEQSGLMQRGAAVTRESQNAFERYDESLAEAEQLLAAGAISQETYRRAVEKLNQTLDDATGYTRAREEATREAEQAAKRAADALESEKTEAAAEAERRLSDAMREGAIVARSVATAEERHAAEVTRLNGLLVMGAIDHQTYARAVDKADDELRQETATTTKAAAETNKLEDAVGKASGKLSALVAINAAQLIGSIASAATNAARSLLAFGNAEAEAIDQTSKLAARIGMTYGELQALRIVEDDISFEQIAAGATRLDVAFVKAARGSKEAKAAFAGLGVSVDDLQGTTAADRFRLVADAIAALPTQAERAAAAVKIFGKSGAELLPLFNQGAGAIAAAEERARALGLALTQDQTNNVQGMKDSFEDAGKAVQGIVQQVVAYLSPAVAEVMTTFTELVGSMGGANIGQTIGEGILSGARAFAGVVDGFIVGSGGVMEAFAAVGDYWSGVFDIGSQVASVFAAIGRGLAGVFQSFVMGITGPIEGLLVAAKAIAGAFGLSSSLLDSATAAATGFNDELAKGAKANFAAAMSNLDAATAPGREIGQAAAGPLTAAIDAAVAKARTAAGGIDETKRTTVDPVGGALGAAAGQKLTAVDSRSKEGISEMFRLMRGGGDDVQERQLDALETIVENTSDMGVDVLELDFAR